MLPSIRHKLVHLMRAMEEHPQINSILLKQSRTIGRAAVGAGGWFNDTTKINTGNYSGVPLTFTPYQLWSNNPSEF